MATTYLKLKDYNRKSDGMHVIRCQLPLRKCTKLEKSCGWRNNGACLYNGDKCQGK